MSTDAEHNAMRERQERTLAAAAASSQIVAFHAAMADTYARRAHGDDTAATSEWVSMAATSNEAQVQVG